MTKWSFRCYNCGLGWKVMHGKLSKDDFLQPKKEGRPVVYCVECKNECVGDMVGQK